MKEFKGIPGSWHYDDVLGGVYSKVGKFVCDVTDKDNANLIAAAPELLEALQKMLSKAYKQNWNDAYPEELKSAQDAINKALGETK